MSIRSAVQTAVLAAALVLIGCVARPTTTDAGTGGGAGGGTGGGTGRVDSGVVDSGVADAGVLPSTISAAKASTFPALVNLKGVVVTAVSFVGKSNSSSYSCADTNTKGTTASFWVADPSTAHSGIYVTKFRCDAPSDYAPAVGDVLDLKGTIGFEEGFNGREKKRFVVKQQYDFIFPTKPAKCELALGCQPLEITKTGTVAALPDNLVDATFGDNGNIRANSSYSGSRVKIAGPLTIGDVSPLALKRISVVPNDSVHYGFRLSNGVLVNNYLTYATFQSDGGLLEDGGTSSCDFRQVKLDGGSVTFASIAGVWDSYTNFQCSDGGTDMSTCFKNYGIPGADAGTTYTNVLYPITCKDFVVQ